MKKKIKELRASEKRNGDFHLFAIFEDGSFEEIKPSDVVEILNEHFEKNTQLDIMSLRRQRKAG